MTAHMCQQKGIAFLDHQFIAHRFNCLDILGLARTDVGSEQFHELDPI